MKKNIFLFITVLSISLFSCNPSTESASTTENKETTEAAGQSAVVDDISNPNVVQIASGSKDHSTLVAAVQAAKLVDVLSNAGPFTVFAPTNAAFDALPAGTVDNLLLAENIDKLATILQYHVYVGVLKTESLKDGQSIGMVDGGNVSITKKENKTYVNGVEIVASIPASNGIIHVINTVLLPK